jgi:transcriptional regulator with XRE-family HTH domain
MDSTKPTLCLPGPKRVNSIWVQGITPRQSFEMGFKENLRTLREKAGLSQTELAKKAGVPFRSYQNWETGLREPRISTVTALAEALGVSVDQLVADEPRRSDAALAKSPKRRGRPKA